MLESARFAISLTLAGTFLLSGLAKLRSGRFVADLANYQLLPHRTVIPVATALPFVEIALAALVLLWLSSAVPVLLAVSGLTLFAAAMIVNLLRGRVIACGCRGSDKPISWSLAGYNVALAFAACVLAAYRPGAGGLNVLESFATVGYVAVAGLGVQLLQRLRQLRSAARLLGLDTRRLQFTVGQATL